MYLEHCFLKVIRYCCKKHLFLHSLFAFNPKNWKTDTTLKGEKPHHPSHYNIKTVDMYVQDTTTICWTT